MTNSGNMRFDVATLLDAVGGEPLAGSGFENELPEPGFDETEVARVDLARGR
jgi:hypothetical protein